MKTLLALAVLAVAGVAALGLAGVDAELCRGLLAEASLSQSLDAGLEASRARNAEIKAVAAELAAGRLSLEEAVEQFRQIEERYGGQPTDQARSVLLWVAQELRARPDCDEVRAWLERERARPEGREKKD